MAADLACATPYSVRWSSMNATSSRSRRRKLVGRLPNVNCEWDCFGSGSASIPRRPTEGLVRADNFPLDISGPEWPHVQCNEEGNQHHWRSGQVVRGGLQSGGWEMGKDEDGESQVSIERGRVVLACLG